MTSRRPGFDLGTYEADHVRDLQWSGEDAYEKPVAAGERDGPQPWTAALQAPAGAIRDWWP